MDTEYPENRKSGVKAGVLLGFRDGVRADREVATGYTLAIQYPTLWLCLEHAKDRPQCQCR